MNIKFRNLFIVLIGLICFVTSAQSETCDWAKKTPPEDGQYKYFVAREFSTKSRKDALQNAEYNITQQVCDVLGNYTSSASDSYNGEKISDSTSSTVQRSRCLGIYKQNFEKMETDDAKIDSNEYIACVKYRYPKDNLRQEQERLNKEGPTSGSMALNEYVGDTICEGQPIEIKTNPAGAYVSLDDNAKYSGTTPLVFGNVCNGSHNLKITLKNHDTVEERIHTSSDKQIFKQLKHSTKNVKISSNLRNSTITVLDMDGFKLKSAQEPLYYDFLSGIEYKIMASNKDANDITISRTFDRDSESSYAFSLSKFTGKIDFTVFKKRNPDVRIYVDGNRVSGNETGPLTADVSHSIEFKKQGNYKKITDSKTVKPKETYSYPSKELVFKKGADNEDRTYIGGYLLYVPSATLEYESYSSYYDFPNVHYNNMLGGGLTFGLKIKANENKNNGQLSTSLRLDGEFQYVANSKNCDEGGYTCNATTKIYSLLGNVYAESFRPNSNYEFYIGVGLGFSVFSEKARIQDSYFEYTTLDNYGFFDLQLAGGVLYKINSDFMLDFGYKLLVMVSMEESDYYYDTPTPLSITVHQFAFGVRYLF